MQINVCKVAELMFAKFKSEEDRSKIKIALGEYCLEIENQRRDDRIAAAFMELENCYRSFDSK